MGQVIGSTNRLGQVPQDRPVHYQDVFATLYHVLGIDVKTATIPDHSGRPQYLLDRPRRQRRRQDAEATDCPGGHRATGRCHAVRVLLHHELRTA
jgi:hypothetical protein